MFDRHKNETPVEKVERTKRNDALVRVGVSAALGTLSVVGMAALIYVSSFAGARSAITAFIQIVPIPDVAPTE